MLVEVENYLFIIFIYLLCKSYKGTRKIMQQKHEKKRKRKNI